MLKDQLLKLFPDHQFEEEIVEKTDVWLQTDPLLCKCEKRNGKVCTIIEGYTGGDEDFKKLAKQMKTLLGVGGSFKNDVFIIQGDFRDKIMTFLTEKGFKVKRVGG